MKKSIGIVFIALALLTSTSGCSGFPKLAAALAKDPATVLIEVNSPYGKQSFVRIGGSANSVTIKDGAVTITPPPPPAPPK